MSRTDKDRPYWVRSRDTTEPGQYDYHRHTTYGGKTITCDYDAAMTYKGSGISAWRRGLVFQCGPELSHWTFRYMVTSSPPPDFEHYSVYNPERRHSRDTLREEAKAYNASGSVDEDRTSTTSVRRRLPYWD